jgi:alpha-ribazole phosphatase
MTRLFLVPHALTDWNIAGRYQGHVDVPLNAAGRAQAKLLARRLVEETFAAIYVSDLCRAEQTASTLVRSEHVQLAAPQNEPRLRELNFGAWEGLTYAEVRHAYPIELARWEADPLQTSPPEGESLQALGARLQSFLAEIIQQRAETILLVAHRGSLRVLLCLALGLPLTDHWRFRLDPASLSILELAPAPALILLNDRRHIEAAHVG